MSTSNISTTQFQQLQLKLNAKIKENELLKQQQARLTEDVEELRQDKKYLRGHNEDLKGDMARLREELAREKEEKEDFKALVKRLQARTPRMLKVEEGSGEVKPDFCTSSALSARSSVYRNSKQAMSRSPSLEVIDVDAIVPEELDSTLGEEMQDLDMDSLDVTSTMDGGDVAGRSAIRDIQEPLTPASQTPGFSAKALGKRKQRYDEEAQPAKRAKPALPEPPWVRESRAKLASQAAGREPSELSLGPPATPPNHAKPTMNLTKAALMALFSPQVSLSDLPSLPCVAAQAPQSPPVPLTTAVLQFQPSEPVTTLKDLQVPTTPEKPSPSPSTPKPTQTQESPSISRQETPKPTPTDEATPRSPTPTPPGPQPDPVVTFPEEQKHHPEEEEEEEEEEEPQRPNVRVKEEYALNLPASVIETYLQGTPKFMPSPAPAPFSVPRVVMRLSYGNSDQHLIQYIPADKNPSGNRKRRLVYPMPDMNPAMPMVPGESGLLFASRPELVKDKQGPWSVFRRERKARWVYLGEYENTLVGKMTKEQFCWQKETVQNHWTKLVSTKRSPKYSQMRARIALRKAGILPVKDKQAASDLVSEELEKMKLGKGHPVDQNDIMEAFKRGEEGIDILRMKCVAYDHVFIDHVADEYQKYRDGKEAEQKEKQVRMLPANHPLRSIAASRAVSTAPPAPAATPAQTASVSTSTRVTRSQKAAASALASAEASTSKLPPTPATTGSSSPGPSAPPRVTRSQKAHHSGSSLRTSSVLAPNPMNGSTSEPSTPASSMHRPATRTTRPPASSVSSTTSESAVAMELQLGADVSPEVSSRGGPGRRSGPLRIGPGGSASVSLRIESGRDPGSSSGSRNWDWTKVYSWDGQKAIAQRAEEEEEEELVEGGDLDSQEQGGYQSDGGLSYVSFPDDVDAGPSTAQPASNDSKGGAGGDGDSGYLSAGGDVLSDVSELTDLDDL